MEEPPKKKSELEGSLSEENWKRARDWMTEKLDGSLTCPVCKETSKWLLEDIRVDLSADILARKWIVPAFCLICTNCGHILLQGAQRAGLKFEEEDGDDDGTQE